MNHAFESTERSGTAGEFSWADAPFAAPFAAAAAWHAAAAVSFGTWMGYWQAVLEGAQSQGKSALMEGAFAPVEANSAPVSDIDLPEQTAPRVEPAVVVEDEAPPEAPETLESVAAPEVEAALAQSDTNVEPVISPAPEVMPVESQPVIEPVAASAPSRPKPPGLEAPRNGSADDLKLISGIGNKTAKTLNELGIWHYDQIARWTQPEAAWIDDYFKFKGRVIREKWIAQADALAAGGVEEYTRRFGKAPKQG